MLRTECVKMCLFNSLWFSQAIDNSRTKSSLVQVMTCRLFDVKPILETMLNHMTVNRALGNKLTNWFKTVQGINKYGQNSTFSQFWEKLVSKYIFSRFSVNYRGVNNIFFSEIWNRGRNCGAYLLPNSNTSTRTYTVKRNYKFMLSIRSLWVRQQ